MKWLFPDGFVGDDQASRRNAALIGVILLIVLGGCAPLFIAAGVEIEHDEWCRTHQTDWHCR